jgi:hypothetical protein
LVELLVSGRGHVDQFPLEIWGKNQRHVRYD